MSPWWSLCTLYLSHRGMQGGVIVGDSGLCCCGPAFNVSRQLFERNYFPLFVDLRRSSVTNQTLCDAISYKSTQTAQAGGYSLTLLYETVWHGKH